MHCAERAGGPPPEPANGAARLPHGCCAPLARRPGQRTVQEDVDAAGARHYRQRLGKRPAAPRLRRAQRPAAVVARAGAGRAAARGSTKAHVRSKQGCRAGRRGPQALHGSRAACPVTGPPRAAPAAAVCRPRCRRRRNPAPPRPARGISPPCCARCAARAAARRGRARRSRGRSIQCHNRRRSRAAGC